MPDLSYLNLIPVALLFLAAEFTKGALSEAGKMSFSKLREALSGDSGADFSPDRPQRFLSESRTVKFSLANDPEVQSELLKVLDLQPALKRAKRLPDILHQAQVLWVDDHPLNNFFECAMMESLGMNVAQTTTTDEAFAHLDNTSYDVIISDMARGGVEDEGLRFLSRLTHKRFSAPTIIYTGKVDPAKGTPPYAFAIADNPSDLLHYALDVLERVRI